MQLVMDKEVVPVRDLFGVPAFETRSSFDGYVVYVRRHQDRLAAERDGTTLRPAGPYRTQRTRWFTEKIATGYLH